MGILQHAPGFLSHASGCNFHPTGEDICCNSQLYCNRADQAYKTSRCTECIQSSKCPPSGKLETSIRRVYFVDLFQRSTQCRIIEILKRMSFFNCMEWPTSTSILLDVSWKVGKVSVEKNSSDVKFQMKATPNKDGSCLMHQGCALQIEVHHLWWPNMAG